MAETVPYEFQAFPSWRYGPDGASAVFDSEAEVPAGWVDHPSKVGEKPARATPPAPPVAKAPAAPADASGLQAPELDAAGVAFDPARHAATKTKTQAGLWRMKVGVSRPESEAKLDL